MALKIGDTAPDFDLPDHMGRQVRLRDFRGKNSVVLAFYVYANTPGWAQELAAYQAGLANFERTGAQVLGISVNKPEANRRFAEKLGLKFPLLCDTEKKVSRQYEVLGFLRVAKRTTFVIDPQGVVRHIDRGSQAMDPASAKQACSILASTSEWQPISGHVESAGEGTPALPHGFLSSESGPGHYGTPLSHGLILEHISNSGIPANSDAQHFASDVYQQVASRVVLVNRKGTRKAIVVCAQGNSFVDVPDSLESTPVGGPSSREMVELVL